MCFKKNTVIKIIKNTSGILLSDYLIYNNFVFYSDDANIEININDFLNCVEDGNICFSNYGDLEKNKENIDYNYIIDYLK